MKDWSDKTILIAEDDSVSYKLLKIMLKPTNATIVWAKNGLEAVEYFKEDNLINAILMDIQMPVMDGYEASSKIREVNPEIPIIVITSYASKDERLKARQAGCDGFINKPVDASILIETIDSCIV